MFRIIKITVLITILLIFFLGCGKKVPNVPIYIDMNGFQAEEYADDFEDKLKLKLKGYGFIIASDNSAPYQIVISDFYYFEYSFEEDAPYDDCSGFNYNLIAYEYGIEAQLLDRNNKSLESWNSSRSKEDELKEDDVYESCTAYKISEPVLLGGSFFRQRAIDIAQKTSKIVAKEY